MLNQNLLLAGDDAYNLERSLRFRSSVSAYLNRTPANASNQQTWTLSMWMKRGSSIGTSFSNIFSARTGSSGTYTIAQFASDVIQFVDNGGMALYTTQVFRDPSAWYHFVFSVDTTQSTSSNRVKLYVNGSQITSFSTATYPSLNANLNVNSTATQLFGQNASSQYADYYLAEVNFVDGQALTPSSFGATSSATEVWQPIKYTGTYGTNGFYLPFTDNSALTTSSNAGLGKDFSGNGNYWTTNNISITSGSTYDSMTDVPTLTNSTTANYAVLNPLDLVTLSLSNGNLTATATSSVSSQIVRATMQLPTSGKWYWEQMPSTGASCAVGITVSSVIMVGGGSTTYNNSIEYQADGNKNVNGTVTAYGATYTTNDVVGVAFDADGGTLTFYKNNSSQGSISITASNGYSPNVRCWSSTVVQSNFGQRPFAYTPPTGFVALNTFNLPTPTIGATASSQAGKYFNPVLYTGTGSSQSITGVGFQPDWTWIKGRSGATDHGLYDAVRGVQKQLESNTTDAETTETTGLTAFGSDGFTVGALAQLNTSTATYVAWNWKANGSGVSNTAGSITSTVSANTTAGFSVVTYTGTGVTGTIGHGLGVAPSMVIVKSRSNASNWYTYHQSIGNIGAVALNLTNATITSSNFWNNTSPTSSVFTASAGSAEINGNGLTYVAYCFAEVAGYSTFGSYTGNGSTDGPFVFIGFRPRYVLVKRTDTTANWTIRDTARNPYNSANFGLFPNLSAAEDSTSGRDIDILSNGFKIRGTDSDLNTNGGTYIFAAFAESPFKYANAR
jgi:hypothetical protein